jgi:hypothetical protein
VHDASKGVGQFGVRVDKATHETAVRVDVEIGHLSD